LFQDGSEENTLDQLLAVDEESVVQGNGTGATDTKHEKSSNRMSSLGDSSPGELKEMTHVSLDKVSGSVGSIKSTSKKKSRMKKPPSLNPSDYPDHIPKVGEVKARRQVIEEMKN